MHIISRGSQSSETPWAKIPWVAPTPSPTIICFYVDTGPYIVNSLHAFNTTEANTQRLLPLLTKLIFKKKKNGNSGILQGSRICKITYTQREMQENNICKQEIYLKKCITLEALDSNSKEIVFKFWFFSKVWDGMTSLT